MKRASVSKPAARERAARRKHAVQVILLVEALGMAARVAYAQDVDEEDAVKLFRVLYRRLECPS